MAESKVMPKAESIVKPKIVTIPCEPGKRMQPVMKMVWHPELRKDVLEKVDEYDIYEFIQASKSTTDKALLMKEFIENGVIPNVDPDMRYDVDFTLFPHDVHELHRTFTEIDERFKALDPDIQAAFGSSDAFFNSVIKGDSAQVINDYYAKKAEEAAAAASGQVAGGQE